MYAELLTPGPSWETIPSAELPETNREQLAKFRAALNHGLEHELLVLNPDEFEPQTSDVKPINAAMASELKEITKSSESLIFLSPEYEWLKKHNLDHFSVLRAAKAETSAHGVFFGLLSDANSEGALPVAVKPCETKPDVAMVDWLNNSLAAKTEKRHFQPVGFMIGGDVAYSITELDRTVETLDNSNWQPVLYDADNPQHEGQRDLLMGVGRAMANLHAKNIAHGDPQFKNIAVDITGNLFFIDWESSTFCDPDVSNAVRVKRAAHDLRILFNSMDRSEEQKGVELLTIFHPSTKWKYFQEYVINPYIEAFLEADQREEAFDQVAEVEEIVCEYVLGNEIEHSTLQTA